MNIKNLIEKSSKPNLYEKGTSVMWTDKYISGQLLQIHLNEDVNLASRKKATIEQTIDWILNKTEKKSLKILDLGCGPGIYSEKLAEKGHQVTAVDFSEASINYAKSQALKKGLNIKYIHSDYLNYKPGENTFDLVLLIYTDFGVLLPDERNSLLRMIYNSLKPTGVFIFDVLNDKEIENKTTPKNWEVSDTGFWRNEGHLVLSESFLYKEEKVILYQHIVIDEKQTDIYRFWTHFFSDSDLANILERHQFQKNEFYTEIIPEEDYWSGKYVTFCITHKN